MTTLAAAIAAKTAPPVGPREYITTTLTGRTRSPIIAVSGGPKVGKSYAIAEASTDPRIGRITLVEVGRDTGAMAEYAAVTGPALSVIEHDGTWNDVAAAIQQAVEQPAPEQGYSILAIDGVTTLWALLSREAQAGGRDIGPGGWANVNATWDALLDTLQHFPGYVIVTARVDADDTASAGRVRAQKDLAYDASVNVQALGYRDFVLTGGRTLALASIPRGDLPVPLGDLNIADVIDLIEGAK